MLIEGNFMINNNLKDLPNGKQMEEIKHNRLNSLTHTLTAGIRQQTSIARSSATPRDSIDYPVFEGSVQYKTPRAFTLPTNPGVYFIHDFRGILYIGEAKNLRNRFLQHHRNEENTLLKELVKYPFGDLRFYWLNAETKLKAVKIQKYWIRVFQPITNNIKYNKDRS